MVFISSHNLTTKCRGMSFEANICRVFVLSGFYHLVLIYLNMPCPAMSKFVIYLVYSVILICFIGRWFHTVSQWLIIE